MLKSGSSILNHGKRSVGRLNDNDGSLIDIRMLRSKSGMSRLNHGNRSAGRLNDSDGSLMLNGNAKLHRLTD